MSASKSKISVYESEIEPWTEMLEKHNFLCKKIPLYKNPESQSLNDCVAYKGKWIDNDDYDYAENKVKYTDENSPLHIFVQGHQNSYADIEPGVHNFVLFWDEKYTLVTSYMNPFEFGSKHATIIERMYTKFPDKRGFLISGEIKKEGGLIKISDSSSQYHFQYKYPDTGSKPISTASTAPASTAPDSTAPDSTAPASTAPASTAPAYTAPAYKYECRTLINQIVKIYLEHIDPSRQMTTKILQSILERNVNKSVELIGLEYDELISKLDANPLSYTPKSDSELANFYKQIITEGMQDAFEKLFEEDKEISDLFYEYIHKFGKKEYGSQKTDVKTFIEKQMCKSKPQVTFDVFDIKGSCESAIYEPSLGRKSGSLDINSCQIPEPTKPAAAKAKAKAKPAAAKAKTVKAKTVKAKPAAAAKAKTVKSKSAAVSKSKRSVKSKPAAADASSADLTDTN